MRTTVDEPASRPNSSRADTSIITAKIPQILRFGLEKLAHAMREQSNRNRYDVDHNSRSCTIYWPPVAVSVPPRHRRMTSEQLTPRP
jgi:hypothetical protein